MSDEKQPERRTASEIQALNEQVAKEFKKKIKGDAEAMEYLKEKYLAMGHAIIEKTGPPVFPAKMPPLQGYSPDFSFTVQEETPAARAFFDYVENGDNPMTLGIEDRIAAAFREFEEGLE